MSEPVVPYRKLPGRSPTFRFGVSAAPSSSLWLGPDHLLLAIQTTAREDYKRFDYRDIQEVFLQETRRRMTLNIILGVVFLIVAMICALNQFSQGSLGFAGVVSAVLLIAFLINTLRGPCCQGYLLTAVGVEPLSSLARFRPAQRALEQLSAEVERVQGVLEPSTLALHWEKR